MPDDTTTTATRQRRLSRLESTELARVATTVTGWKLSRDIPNGIHRDLANIKARVEGSTA